MMFDTDVLIWEARGNTSAARVINSAKSRSLSIISLMELLQGARSKIEAHRIRQSLWALQFQVVPLSESIGTRATSLIEQYALAHRVRVADALVAATAIEMGEPLCTGNSKHFRPIRGLSVVAYAAG